MHTRVNFQEIENLPSHTHSRSQWGKCVTGICPTFSISRSPQNTNTGIDISPQPLYQFPKEVSLSSMPHSRNPFPKPAFYPQLRPPNWREKETRKETTQSTRPSKREFPGNSTGHRSNWKYLGVSNSSVNVSFSFTMSSVTDSTMNLAVSVLILPSQKGLCLKCLFQSSTVFVKTWFSESSRESLL